MLLKRYSIYQFSARTLLSEATKTEDGFKFHFDIEAASNSHAITKTVQSDCGMYRQLYLALHGKEPGNSFDESDALLQAIIYLDFTGVFDRHPVGWVKELQRRAEWMFRPEGIQIDFGKETFRFVAFERSASMSRENKLSFVRADLFEPMWERMTLGMEIRQCQLSKLYAYNGLLFSDGRRIEAGDYKGFRMDADHIIVVDNPRSMVKDVSIVTVEDDGTDRPVRRYSRVEQTADVEVLEYDGEGLVSKKLGEQLSHASALEAGHYSFQIRLPYIKGVVHAVDYHALFAELGVTEITDSFGKRHSVADVDMILTRSMCKGLGWMKENGLSWSEYLERCREYGHSLYVTGMDHRSKDGLTELNYQLLNTAAITAEEYRPADLSFRWDASPEECEKEWLTKATETAYYNTVMNEAWQMDYFLSVLNQPGEHSRERKYQQAQLLQKNPAFLKEQLFQKELEDKAQSLRTKFSIGKLLISGETRYLSDDLMRLLACIVRSGSETAYQTLLRECLSGAQLYAPQPSYPVQPQLTVLRNPHISRNEEVLMTPLQAVGPLREKYLSHLFYIAMVDSRSLIPDRLGGADYDGDTVHIYADPILNRCIRYHYRGGLENENNLPLLKIPAAAPLIADARDWQARFQAVKSTFSSRIGQISNAALRRSIPAYNEHTIDWLQEQHRKETETLTILTGLEIDSTKTGVKPDLSEYLLDQTEVHSEFLKYKQILGDPEEHKWYEPSKAKRLRDYFKARDWNEITANLERTPWYALELGKQTRPPKAVPAESTELFAFAATPGWQEAVNPATLAKVKTIIETYEEAKRRCDTLRHLTPSDNCKTDIRRILFSRNQEELVSVDELYLIFRNHSPWQIREAFAKLRSSGWQFTPPDQRAILLYEIVGRAPEYIEILCDFRCSGYRILGDILEDLNAQIRLLETKKNAGIKKNDSPLMKAMLRDVLKARDVRETLISNCFRAITPKSYHFEGEDVAKENEYRLQQEEIIMCAEMLGKRDFILEVFPAAARSMVVDRTEKTKKKRWWKLW